MAFQSPRNHEIKTVTRIIVTTVFDRMYRRWRLQQRAWVVYLAGNVRNLHRCSDLVSAFQAPRLVTALLQNRSLRADADQVPALKRIDGFIWHQAYERSLKIQRFGYAPV